MSRAFIILFAYLDFWPQGTDLKSLCESVL